MKKFLKIVAIALLVLGLALVGAAALLTSLFEKPLGQRITKELNKQLTTELQVRDFDLALIRTFPNAAANFKGVRLMDRFGGVLLEADELSFRFAMLSLFGPKLQLRSVVISDGGVQVVVDEKGRANYDIFVASPDEPAETQPVTVSLESARLRNIELNYSDRVSRLDMAALVQDGTISGEFSSQRFALKSQAELTSRFVTLDGMPLLVDKPISYDAIVDVDLEARKYQLGKVLMKVAENTFRVDGAIESWDSGTYFDLFAKCEQGKLEGILGLLPGEYGQKLEDFSSKGKFEFSALVKGQYNDRQNPEIRAEFSLQDGQLIHPQMKQPLKDVRFSASFTNGKFRDNRSAVFRIEDFRAYFKRELIELKLEIADLDDPQVDFYLDGAVPMEALYGFLGNPSISGGSGEIEIEDLRLKGAYRDMINPGGIARVQASGSLVFDDAAIALPDEKLVLDRGVLRLDGNRLSVENLRLEGAGSDLSFSGTAYNLLPVLLADSLNSQDAALVFEASLFALSLDIDRLLKFSALTEEQQQAAAPVVDSLHTEQIGQRERLTNLLKGTFNADVKGFNYELIEGRDFVGKLDFDRGTMNIKGRVSAMDGSFELDGNADFERRPKLKARLTAIDINASEFFRQSENFGQEVLQDKHLKGRLDAQMLIEAFWDEQGQFLYDELHVLASLSIKDGELLGLEMLESFSSFVNIRDLRHIRFVGLQNYLEVRNQRVYLPAMFIRSNALNLTLSGEHSFDNDIEYYLKVNAGQVLADRFRRHDASLRPKAARRRGWFNLHYRIAGNLDDYRIESSKRQVRADFERSEMRRREIQRALEREFGTLKQRIEEPAEWQDVDGNPVEFLDFDM
jgi:hypothetical protein